jgi:hypothetical protein
MARLGLPMAPLVRPPAVPNNSEQNSGFRPDQPLVPTIRLQIDPHGDAAWRHGLRHHHVRSPSPSRTTRRRFTQVVRDDVYDGPGVRLAMRSGPHGYAGSEEHPTTPQEVRRNRHAAAAEERMRRGRHELRVLNETQDLQAAEARRRATEAEIRRGTAVQGRQVHAIHIDILEVGMMVKCDGRWGKIESIKKNQHTPHRHPSVAIKYFPSSEDRRQPTHALRNPMYGSNLRQIYLACDCHPCNTDRRFRSPPIYFNLNDDEAAEPQRGQEPPINNRITTVRTAIARMGGAMDHIGQMLSPRAARIQP